MVWSLDGNVELIYNTEYFYGFFFVNTLNTN